MIRGCQQETGVAETVRRRLGVGKPRGIDAELGQIAFMQGLFDGDSLQRTRAERPQRFSIGAPRTGDRQDARILRQIQRVLHDVALEALSAQLASRQLRVERQFVDRRAQVRGALPGCFGELRHCAASSVQSAWK